MEPFKALIVPLDSPPEPPTGGGAPHPGHDLPLFPFHPIVVPPGGQWPGEPPIEPPDPNAPHPDHELPGPQPRPDIDLPLFPFHPIVVPPGGAYPKPPEPVDPNAPKPTNPINLPPSDSGYWIFVYILGLGWVWIAVPPTYKPPTEGTEPPTTEPAKK